MFLPRCFVVCASTLAALALLGQESTIDQTRAYQVRSASASSWLHKASVPGTESVNSDARGKYFDSLSGSVNPLDSTNQTGNGQGRSEGIPVLNEFPRADAVVVASFTRHTAFLTPSHKSIYTQLDLIPSKVIKAGVGIPSTYALLIQGGTVILPSATDQHRVISHGIVDDPYVLQPRTSYLLFLRYHKDSDFYTLRKSWLITDGVLAPNSAVEEQRVKTGASQHSGKTLNQVESEIELQR